MEDINFVDKSRHCSKEDKINEERDDLMFSLKSRDVVVKLIDIKDQFLNKNIKIVTDFANEAHEWSKEDDNKQSKFKLKEERVKFLNLISSVHENTKKYICKICSKRFKKKIGLKTHKITHSDKKIKCDMCEKSYKHSWSVQTHREREHAVALGIKRGVHVCKKCKKHFSTKRSLEVHTMIHDNLKHHDCEICGKTFVQKGNLQNHVKLHSEERPFACTLCPSKFKTKKDVRRHQIVHSDVLNFSCNECDKQFKYRSMLKDHVWIHSNPSGFVCDICGISCNSPKSLTTHKKVHDLSQTFSCKLCGKEFFHKTLIKKHKVLVHSTETFDCEQCKKIFSCRQYLRNHMKTHSQLTFRCVCGKTYKNKISLRDHIVLHNH